MWCCCDLDNGDNSMNRHYCSLRRRLLEFWGSGGGWDWGWNLLSMFIFDTLCTFSLKTQTSTRPLDAISTMFEFLSEFNCVQSWKPTRKIVFTPKISSSSNGSRDDFSRSWHSLPPSSYTTYIPRTLDWFWEIILLRRKGPYGNIKAFLMLHI